MDLNNYVIVDGPSEPELNDYISFLLSEYEGGSKENPSYIYVYQSVENRYIITFSESPGFDTMSFYINFLTYPIKKDNSSPDPTTLGYYIVNEDDNLGEELVGKRLMVYVSKNDTEHDNVSGVYHGAEHAFLFSFQKDAKPVKQDFKELEFVEPEIDKRDFTLINTLQVKAVSEKKTKKGCMPLVLLLSVTIVAGLLFVI